MEAKALQLAKDIQAAETMTGEIRSAAISSLAARAQALAVQAMLDRNFLMAANLSDVGNKLLQHI